MKSRIIGDTYFKGNITVIFRGKVESQLFITYTIDLYIIILLTRDHLKQSLDFKVLDIVIQLVSNKWKHKAWINDYALFQINR